MRADTLLSKPLPITYDTATAVAGRITGYASNDDVYAGAVPTTTTCSPRSQDAAPLHWPVPLPVIATPGRPPPSARERRLLSMAAARSARAESRSALSSQRARSVQRRCAPASSGSDSPDGGCGITNTADLRHMRLPALTSAVAERHSGSRLMPVGIVRLTTSPR